MSPQKGVKMGKFKQILSDINELIVFKHSIFALPFIFCAMIVASFLQNKTIFFGVKLLILGLICAVSARSFAMAFNRLVDEDIDKFNPRCSSRPSVDGRIGRRNLMLFIALNALIFIGASYFVNSLAFALSFPILLILGGYSLFKRFSEMAHVVLGFCLGLSPIAGAVCVSGEIPLFSVLLCFGVMFWTAGFDVLYSLQDLEYDRENGLFSIPSIYGEKAAMFLAKIFHFTCVLFWFCFAMSANLGVVGFIGVGVSAVILCAEHIIVARDFSKIDRAFFTLNGYLGIMFFLFVLIDLIIRS